MPSWWPPFPHLHPNIWNWMYALPPAPALPFPVIFFDDSLEMQRSQLPQADMELAAVAMVDLSQETTPPPLMFPVVIKQSEEEEEEIQCVYCKCRLKSLVELRHHLNDKFGCINWAPSFLQQTPPPQSPPITKEEQELYAAAAGPLEKRKGTKEREEEAEFTTKRACLYCGRSFRDARTLNIHQSLSAPCRRRKIKEGERKGFGDNHHHSTTVPRFKSCRYGCSYQSVCLRYVTRHERYRCPRRQPLLPKK